jgi:glucose-1-phosphatase
MYNDVKYLLFDLGGVLVELVGVPKMLQWMNNRVDKDEMSRMWLFSPSVRGFEMGRLTPDEFAKSIIEEFGFCVNVEQFIKDFTYFPSGFYTGVRGLLKDLSKKYSIACLSNINELHWNRLCNDDCIKSLIPIRFPSHKTGYMKPDKEAYLNVITELKCEPSKILFFDDNKINVDAAIETGMKAIWVRDFDDLKQKLEEIGII